MTESIKDKVAIVGMGCTRFGEHWDKDDWDMIVDACYEAFEDAGVNPKDIPAAWLSCVFGRHMGITLSQALKLEYIPVSRVENMCGSAADAFRNACYSIAAGVFDLALVCGVEKLKDSGMGLVGSPMELHFGSWVHPLATHIPASYEALLATRYMYHRGWTYEEFKRLLAMIAVKNHRNGMLTPKAHLHREITVEEAMKARIVCWPFGLYDCCAMTDGCAAAIVCRADMAKSFRDDYILVKAAEVCLGFKYTPVLTDFVHLEEARRASQAAYAKAGIENPRRELDMAEVHDAFTVLELVFYEDLGFSPPGHNQEDVAAGTFALDGELPVNSDGGLKCFGHPLGATGLRQMYEVYKQIQGKAGEHQLNKVDIGLTQNMGGLPWGNASAVTILGRRD